MPNKTIIGLFITLIIAVCLIFTGAPEALIYTCLALIAALCGVSLIKNNLIKK